MSLKHAQCDVVAKAAENTTGWEGKKKNNCVEQFHGNRNVHILAEQDAGNSGDAVKPAVRRFRLPPNA